MSSTLNTNMQSSLLNTELSNFLEKDLDSDLKKDSKGRTYGTGRRKSATARVWLQPGSGTYIVNSKDISSYFSCPSHVQIALRALAVTSSLQQFNINCTVKGGGISGQAGAVQLGIARALNDFNSELHITLRKQGCLTRDSRAVERKKYGRHKARKRPQFSKR